MKQSSAQSSIFEEFQLPSQLENDVVEDLKYFPLDRTLRTLGTMLQLDGFAEFELRVKDDLYVVHRLGAAEKSAGSSLFEKLLSLGRRREGDPCANRELRYSMTDLLTFETQVRERRKQSSEMPDPYSLSQILRGVGCYLDKRERSRLLSVVVKDRWVTIEYLAGDGRAEKAHQDFEYFYNYWVKMYMQRSNRAKLPPPSDPTLLVTWESGLRRHQLKRVPA